MASRRGTIEGQLRERLRYFLGTSARGRREVVSILNRLALQGHVLIFGGMLRDLLLSGNAGFDSDVDVVLAGAEGPRLEQVLIPLEARRNRFGGYRLAGRHWKIDVWRLEDTWAFKHALVVPPEPAQLVRTTFFTWDAAVFNVGTGQLWFHEKFEDHLLRRVLDVNLLPNPNPIGAGLRAIRSVLRYHARMTRSVADYVLEVIKTHGAERLVERERLSYTDPVLTTAIMRDLQQHLEVFVSSSAHGHVEPPLYQYALNLTDRK